MARWRLGAAVALVAVCSAAYMPVQVDADRQGRLLVARQEGVFAIEAEGTKAELLTKPVKGLPVVARWSPGGDKVLLAEVLDDLRMALSVVTVADKTVQDLGAFKGLRTPLWSPDGTSVSYAVQEPPGFALYVAPATGGQARKLLGGVGGSYDWADKGHLAAFRLGTKQAASGASEGELVLVDAGTGDATSVAAMSAGELAPIDVNASGKDALVVRTAADGKTQLVRVTLSGGKTQPVGPENVLAGVWSPDGERIVAVHMLEREITSQVVPPPGQAPAGVPPGGTVALKQKVRTWHLSVMKAGGAEVKILSEEADAWQATWADSPLLPNWSAKDTVIFFRKARVYGDAGTAMHLMSAKAAGGAVKDLQPAIDAAVAKAVK